MNTRNSITTKLNFHQIWIAIKMSLVKRALVSLWKRNRATIAGGTRADSRFASSQWETALLSNDVSHWLGASIVSAVCCSDNPWFYYTFYANTITPITLCQTRCNIFYVINHLQEDSLAKCLTIYVDFIPLLRHSKNHVTVSVFPFLTTTITHDPPSSIIYVMY